MADITSVPLERTFVFVVLVIGVFAHKDVSYASRPTLDQRIPPNAKRSMCTHIGTMADLIAHLPHFLETINPDHRMHSALEYQSPNKY